MGNLVRKLTMIYLFICGLPSAVTASDLNADLQYLPQLDVSMKEANMFITLSTKAGSVVYALNDSDAAKELHAQLPMTIKVEEYGGKEIIFYPPKKLKTDRTPLVKKAFPGTLAYYAPWGDVVMFYDHFGSASGLYELGKAISDVENIKSLSGVVRLDRG